MQTVQIQVSLVLIDQSDHGQHCLLVQVLCQTNHTKKKIFKKNVQKKNGIKCSNRTVSVDEEAFLTIFHGPVKCLVQY